MNQTCAHEHVCVFMCTRVNESACYAQAWLEGSLGVRNVVVANNVLHDCTISVGPSTKNITLRNNTCTPIPCNDTWTM